MVILRQKSTKKRQGITPLPFELFCCKVNSNPADRAQPIELKVVFATARQQQQPEHSCRLQL